LDKFVDTLQIPLYPDPWIGVSMIYRSFHHCWLRLRVTVLMEIRILPVAWSVDPQIQRPHFTRVWTKTGPARPSGLITSPARPKNRPGREGGYSKPSTGATLHQRDRRRLLRNRGSKTRRTPTINRATRSTQLWRCS